MKRKVAVPPIPNEVFAANRRSAQYLASRTDMQDFPRWEIEDINTQGASAIAKTADLIGQTHDLDPDQAKHLYERVIIGINPDAQDKLDEMLFGDTSNNQDDVLDLNLEEALSGSDGSEALSTTIAPERQLALGELIGGQEQETLIGGSGTDWAFRKSGE